ncbi:hypothetical protein BDM02DRAFT_3106013 [Thelephora ganbajun]|uniref:Uncharacterized protein n=1 Tax=Thelephora ganbajun TaxID=370292 RepID=A0ACB6YXW0_THEGA|nr:hypothetical protein BDM02DRAFT_3106013 [Thelephora ganbajun]
MEVLEKRINSSQSNFEGGPNGLQAHRARAIHSYLHMLVRNDRQKIEASERAAEAQGFATQWGGRQVRSWAELWIKDRKLPKSRRGKHIKLFTLLEDPDIHAELRSYIRSNKWAVDPTKLTHFSAKKMLPKVAEAYGANLMKKEIPVGLKKYLKLELFPRIHMKVARGVSLSTAPQANNGKKMSWVHEKEHALKKKGAGRGIHQSDVICSTMGWLKSASQSLEYGKNYEGYWNGELFVKQLKEKIIPAFEDAHGPGYQALFLIDNSQGHSAYSADALLASRMNLHPGGKQARMRDGWFIQNGQKVTQPMVFPNDHPEFPNQPKGMKRRYLRENCDYTFATLQENLPKALESVLVETIQKWEHRMWRWVDAYDGGMGAHDAQLHIQKFSSRKYKSHRRIPEGVAAQLDH